MGSLRVFSSVSSCTHPEDQLLHRNCWVSHFSDADPATVFPDLVSPLHSPFAATWPAAETRIARDHLAPGHSCDGWRHGRRFPGSGIDPDLRIHSDRTGGSRSIQILWPGLIVQ